MNDADAEDRSQDREALCRLERKCLALAASGKNTQEIAGDVGITPREAQILLHCAQRKLGASNTMQAVARYLADEMTGTMVA